MCVRCGTYGRVREMHASFGGGTWRK